MYYKCVKFHKNPISGLGVALTRYMDGRTDRRTDGVIPIYPLTLLVGGMGIKTIDIKLQLTLVISNSMGPWKK